MKKILIGTHNVGKFRELSILLSKKTKKISPKILKIKSPEETGKTFKANAKLKAKYLIVTNGIKTIALHCAPKNVKQINNMPKYLSL